MRTIATKQKGDLEEFRSKLLDEIYAVKSQQFTIEKEQKSQVLSDKIQTEQDERVKVQHIRYRLKPGDWKVKQHIFDFVDSV